LPWAVPPKEPYLPPSTKQSKPVTQHSPPKKDSLEPTPDVTDNDEHHDFGPSARKEEVSAEVPKFGVLGESHRASQLEILSFEKDKA
jgi:hypothetical protein